MLQMTITDLIALAALILSILSALGNIWNYIHTNKMFEMTRYPKLVYNTPATIVVKDVSTITVSIKNTHTETSVSKLKVIFRIYKNSIFDRYRRREVIFDAHFQGASTILCGEEIRISTFNILEDIANTFPSILKEMFQKERSTPRSDGTTKKTTYQEHYYSVLDQRPLTLKMELIYTPDLVRSKPRKEVKLYDFKPQFDSSDEYKTLKSWRIKER